MKYFSNIQEKNVYFFYLNLGEKYWKRTNNSEKNQGKVNCKTAVNVVVQQSWKYWTLKQHWFCGSIKAITTLSINCTGKIVLILGETHSQLTTCSLLSTNA